jgi:hypothetical protein
VIYLLLLIGGAIWFDPARRVGAFLAYVIALSAGLVAICWRRGEPPRWRWGGDD